MRQLFSSHCPNSTTHCVAYRAAIGSVELFTKDRAIEGWPGVPGMVEEETIKQGVGPRCVPKKITSIYIW